LVERKGFVLHSLFGHFKCQVFYVFPKELFWLFIQIDVLIDPVDKVIKGLLEFFLRISILFLAFSLLSQHVEELVHEEVEVERASQDLFEDNIEDIPLHEDYIFPIGEVIHQNFYL